VNRTIIAQIISNAKLYILSQIPYRLNFSTLIFVDHSILCKFGKCGDENLQFNQIAHCQIRYQIPLLIYGKGNTSFEF